MTDKEEMAKAFGVSLETVEGVNMLMWDIQSQLPVGAVIIRMYAAAEGGLRLVIRTDDGDERRYTVHFDNGRPIVQYMP